MTAESKKIEITPHAIQMMKEREISLHWVESAILHAERTVPDAANPDRTLAFARVPEFEGRWLRVVYEEAGQTIRVITAFFDRGAERKK